MVRNRKVCSVLNTDEDISSEEGSSIPSNLSEHVDNAFLNRDIHTGILGFCYENKDNSLLVYSSVEAKTFCMIMYLKPI